MKKILIAHDGSKHSEKAVKKGFQLAGSLGAAVTVMTVVPDLYLNELMEIDRAGILETLTEEATVEMEKVKASAKGLKSVKTMISQGDPASEVLSAAVKMKADLIITGSHGRHGAGKFLLGSVSAKIVDHAECSVLVVK